MEKVTSPKEIAAGRTKFFTCTSGHTYEIQKMPITTLAKYFATTGVTARDTKTIEAEIAKTFASPEKIVEAMNIIIPGCVIAPKIVLEGLTTDEQLALIDMPPGDQFEVFIEAMSFSGISGIAAKERKLFRKKRNR